MVVAFLTLSCVATGFAPERAPVDLAGFSHLEAIGIAAPRRQRSLDSAGYSTSPQSSLGQSKTIPSLASLSLPSLTDKGESGKITALRPCRVLIYIYLLLILWGFFYYGFMTWFWI